MNDFILLNCDLGKKAYIRASDICLFESIDCVYDNDLKSRVVYNHSDGYINTLQCSETVAEIIKYIKLFYTYSYGAEVNNFIVKNFIFLHNKKDRQICIRIEDIYSIKEEHHESFTFISSHNVEYHSILLVRGVEELICCKETVDEIMALIKNR
ncbi:MAG: hypothetical protein OEY10_00305 [Nitrosopumilus sp.]|nr:hypothetical protein [Nitrosopumilus sp.]